MNDSEIILLVIVCAIVVFFIFALIIDYHDRKKEKKKYKKSVDELKIGNKYQMKEYFLRSDNPFKVDPTFIVEIIDIKYNDKNKMYVQYKQIEPEYKGKPFSEPFKEFIVFFDLIK